MQVRKHRFYYVEKHFKVVLGITRGPPYRLRPGKKTRKLMIWEGIWGVSLDWFGGYLGVFVGGSWKVC